MGVDWGLWCVFVRGEGGGGKGCFLGMRREGVGGL